MVLLIISWILNCLVMTKGYCISSDFLEVKKCVWSKNEVYYEQASFNSIGFGYSPMSFQARVNGVKIDIVADQVSASGLQTPFSMGIDVDKKSHEYREAYLFRFDPFKVSQILNSLHIKKTKIMSEESENHITENSTSFITLFDDITSYVLRNIFSSLITLHFQPHSLLRNRMIELKIEEVFIMVLRSEYGTKLAQQINRYDTSNPFSYLIYKINNELHKNWSVADLAKQCDISEPSVYRYFQKSFGISPNKYIWSKKIEKSKKLLKEARHLNVSEVGYAIGIKRSAYFARVFKKSTGFSPNEFRNK